MKVKKHVAILCLLLAGSAAGCTSQPIRATGAAAVDAYESETLSRAQKILLAKRGAMVDAQRNLIEEYAGTFLSSETEVRDFVARHDRVISRSGGLLRGVRKVDEQWTPDNAAVVVTVESTLADLEAVLKRRR
jgi:hypothetical protein